MKAPLQCIHYQASQARRRLFVPAMIPFFIGLLYSVAMLSYAAMVFQVLAYIYPGVQVRMHGWCSIWFEEVLMAVISDIGVQGDQAWLVCTTLDDGIMDMVRAHRVEIRMDALHYILVSIVVLVYSFHL